MSELVVKYLTGEATNEEQNALQEWLKDDPEHKGLFDSYRKIWEGMDKVSGITTQEIENEWSRLEIAINEQETRVVTLEPAKYSRRSILRIAATVALLVSSFTIIYWFISQSSELQILAGNESMEHTFPDGSVASLNYNSSISYKKNFGEKTRSLELNGEAFFDVKKDPDKPFVIHSGNLEIKVLGTSFNVNAYPEADMLDVVVESGSVSVKLKGRAGSTVTLEKGDKATFTKSEMNLFKSVNTDKNYLAWKTRRIVFEETSMTEVVELLSKVYGRILIIDSPSLEKCPITVTFDSQSLDAVLAVISSTLDVTTKQTENQIILSGEGCYVE